MNIYLVAAVWMGMARAAALISIRLLSLWRWSRSWSGR